MPSCFSLPVICVPPIASADNRTMTISPRGYAVRFAVLVVAAFTLLMCMAVAAAAHAVLLSSIPAAGQNLSVPPSGFSLYFSEAVTPVVVTLVDAAGSDHTISSSPNPSATVRIDTSSPFPDGRYALSWRVISDDGHPIAGAVVFSIGSVAPTDAPTFDAETSWNCQALTLATRFLTYIGCFFGVGGLFFYKVVCKDDQRRSWILTAILLGAVSAIASLCLLGMDELGLTSIAQLNASVFFLGCASSLGRAVAVLEIALMLGTAAYFVRGRLSTSLATVSFILLPLAFALSGHAATAQPRWLSSSAVYVHILGISFWIGSILPLCGLLRNPTANTASLQRFSSWIPLAIGAMLVSGAYLSLLQLGGFRVIWTTAYGKIYLAKIALVLAALALGSLNRLKFTPRVFEGSQRDAVVMKHSIAVETIVIALVLAVVSLWRFTPPPRTLALEAPIEVQTHIHTEQAMADVEFRTTSDLTTSSEIFLSDADFGPLGAREVTVTFVDSAGRIAPFKVAAAKKFANRWGIGPTPMPCNCDWNIRIEALVSEFKMLELEGSVKLRP